MTSLQNGSSNKQTTGNEFGEDEINLIDYFFVLWKHKFLILLCSVLPTVIVGLVLYLSPRSYRVTYTYDTRDDIRDISGWNLNEKNYKVFVGRFCDEENINKISDKLQENGLDDYAKLLRNAGNNLDGLLKFEPVPSYVDLSKTNITDPQQLEQFQKLTAQLLNITIVGRPKKELQKISLIIRDNLEKVMPLYMIQERLSADIRRFKTMLADIESSRFSHKLTLKTNKSALEMLKNIELRAQDKIESNIILQFDVDGKSEHLPLKYQIQASEAKIVEILKQAEASEEEYKYYKNLLSLNKKLLAGLKKSISSYYTIQQYRSFLIKLIGDYEAKELKDYLASYIKGIENRISISAPVSEIPKISLIAKHTVKRSAIVFVIALMISVFASFLLEGLKKAKTQAS